MKHANPGSVSSGTLRTPDLIEAFGDALESCIFMDGDRLSKPENFGERDRLNNLRGEAQDYDEARDEEESGGEVGAELVQELTDALGEYAPPYFYFGAHPGDGADFGFWLSVDALQDFDGLRVEDTSEVPDDYTGEVLHVNDHGNTSLYVADHGELREVWAIV